MSCGRRRLCLVLFVAACPFLREGLRRDLRRRRAPRARRTRTASRARARARTRARATSESPPSRPGPAPLLPQTPLATAVPHAGGVFLGRFCRRRRRRLRRRRRRRRRHRIGRCRLDPRSRQGTESAPRRASLRCLARSCPLPVSCRRLPRGPDPLCQLSPPYVTHRHGRAANRAVAAAGRAPAGTGRPRRFLDPPSLPMRNSIAAWPCGAKVLLRRFRF